ncbi:hypothetical protein B194_2589 [Serratia plymuthica A30]|nr:hypothetical protein B194_2589 [Serratia plymuthica A30]
MTFSRAKVLHFCIMNVSHALRHGTQKIIEMNDKSPILLPALDIYSC